MLLQEFSARRRAAAPRRLVALVRQSNHHLPGGSARRAARARILAHRGTYYESASDQRKRPRRAARVESVISIWAALEARRGMVVKPRREEDDFAYIPPRLGRARAP
jgi:hypothetical protein